MIEKISGRNYETKVRRTKGGTETFGAKLLESSFGEQIADLRRRRDEQLITVLSNGKGRELSRDQIIDRGSLHRTFKNKRVWVRLRSSGKELGEYFCLGFDGEDMHARCVDRGNKLHVFDPDEVEFESRAERTLRFVKDRSRRLNRGIDEMNKMLVELTAEKDRIDRMIRRTDNEVKRERKRSRLDRFLKQENREGGRKERDGDCTVG